MVTHNTTMRKDKEGYRHPLEEGELYKDENQEKILNTISRMEENRQRCEKLKFSLKSQPNKKKIKKTHQQKLPKYDQLGSFRYEWRQGMDLLFLVSQNYTS